MSTASMHSDLVLTKALYILSTAGATGWGKFATIYFSSKGVSATNLGALKERGLGLSNLNGRTS